MKYAFLLLLFAISYSHAKTDEEAIVSLLKKESSTWRSGDIKAHASCWSFQPYSRIIISMPDRNSMDVPPAMMINPPEHMVGKGGGSKNSNYKMNINGNNAWVTHDEESTTIDGVTN